MEGHIERANPASKETPEEARYRESVAALQRTLSSEDFELFRSFWEHGLSQDELAARVAEFNRRKPGTADAEESLDDRVQMGTQFNLPSGARLSVSRSMRGTFSIEVLGASH